MDGSLTKRWEDELERWLEPFLQRLRRKAQRRWAPIYLKGLLLPGERKSIEPMAARVAPGDTQQVHHFVSTSPWATAPLEDELVKAADRLGGGAGGGGGEGGGPAGGRAGRGAGGGRHRAVEAGPPLGRGQAPVLRPARQAGQLPGPGLAHPGAERGAGRGRPAAVPARGLGRRRRAARGRGRARDRRVPAEVEDRPRRDRSCARLGRPLRARAGRRRVRQGGRVPARPGGTGPASCRRRRSTRPT